MDNLLGFRRTKIMGSGGGLTISGEKISKFHPHGKSPNFLHIAMHDDATKPQITVLHVFVPRFKFSE